MRSVRIFLFMLFCLILCSCSNQAELEKAKSEAAKAKAEAETAKAQAEVTKAQAVAAKAEAEAAKARAEANAADRNKTPGNRPKDITAAKELPNLPDTMAYLKRKIQSYAGVDLKWKEEDNKFNQGPKPCEWIQGSTLDWSDGEEIRISTRVSGFRTERNYNYEDFLRNVERVETKRVEIGPATHTYVCSMKDLDPDVTTKRWDSIANGKSETPYFKVTLHTTDGQVRVGFFQADGKIFYAYTFIELWFQDEKEAIAVQKALTHAITLAGGKQSKGANFDK